MPDKQPLFFQKDESLDKLGQNGQWREVLPELERHCQMITDLLEEAIHELGGTKDPYLVKEVMAYSCTMLISKQPKPLREALNKIESLRSLAMIRSQEDELSSYLQRRLKERGVDM